MAWKPVMLRGTRVLARCDDAGTLLATDGRVEIRYKPSDGKSYRALAQNLEAVHGAEVLPDAHCGDAAPVAKKAEAGEAKSEGVGSRAASGARSPAKKAAKSGTAPVVPDGVLVAYTDGACSGNPGPCGLGVVLLTDGERSELSEYLGTGTNNIAELTAILRALERLEKTERALWVHTDSQYAIGVLTKGWKAKANQELIAALKASMRHFPKLELVYVPGHAGVPLNERADELARAAVSSRRSPGWGAAP
jgi:ribonuclease HI